MLGFGTWRLAGEQCRSAIETALNVGYRHIDTADGYGNQQPVGAAVRSAGVPREELFITSKVGRDDIRWQGVIDICQKALRELEVDYLDLFLVHWPNTNIPMDETFGGMRKLLDDGLIRACGVSNFTASRLERALALKIAPISVNQVEYHPLLNQKDLHECCKRHGVVLTAYSPLAQGKIGQNEIIRSVAQKYGRTAEQVTLRWLLQREIVAIPKASSRAHIESNFNVFDFTLSPEDFNRIDNINAWERLITWDVAEFDR